jgi:hypothetical protein
MAETIEIRTARETTPVDHEQFDEFASRIRAAGRDDVADQLIARQNIAEEDKPFVLAVLDTWLDDARNGTFPKAFDDLRLELDWDVSHNDPL